jgi:hypothetical protein
MDPDILKAALGAVAGFVLAQLVNLARVLREWFTEPRLAIEMFPNCLLMFGDIKIDGGKTVRNTHYGFMVRNTGRRIAAGVRFQILEIETRSGPGDEFSSIHGTVLDLFSENGLDKGLGSREATIVPKAAISVTVATWRSDQEAIMIATDNVPERWDFLASTAQDFRFTVVAFGENAHFVTTTLIIRTKDIERSQSDHGRIGRHANRTQSRPRQ